MRRDDFSDNKIATILKFIELVLTSNNLKFQGSHYVQMTGTAMGKRMALTYANLYMGGLETELQDKALHKPLLWRRIIDDIFFLWTHGRAKLEQFYQQCNLFDPNISFEQTVSDKSIPFLDVLVILKDGKIELAATHAIQRHPFHTAKRCVYATFVQRKNILRIERETSTRSFSNGGTRTS